MRHIKKTLIAMLLALIMAPAAQAMQVVDPVEGEAMFVNVSQNELNMIKFPVAGIRAYTSSSAVDIKVQGRQVLVNMIDKSATKPQEVFFSTPSGTYLLMLTPKKIPAETVVVQIDRARVDEAMEWELEHDYIKRLKELMKALYAGTPPGGYSLNGNKIDASRWEGIEETIITTMTGAGLVGEVHEIVNHSKKTVRIVEPEFYREGVLAVTLLGHEIKTGEKSQVFIIRSNYQANTVSVMGPNIGRPLETGGKQ